MNNKDLDASLKFANLLIAIGRRRVDTRGDILKRVADELSAADQHYTASLFYEIAAVYGLSSSNQVMRGTTK